MFRYSFWFLPSLFVMAAVVLAVVLIQADDWFGRDMLERWPRLVGAGADGARGLLTTVASSMITVAGVVFSITLVALSQAASQYSPRVIRNFLRNRTNQSVLATFVGIFAYCLIVLRTIRAGNEGSAFVPHVAVLFGLVLGFVGIGVLIHFVHHVSTSIQASSILAAATHETLAAIDHLFPNDVGEAEEAGATEQLEAGASWHAVPTRGTGYIQALDLSRLLNFADERDTVVRMERRIGEFVFDGVPVLSVLGVAPGKDDCRRLRRFFSIGAQQTVEQDAAFGIRQIVDVASKALSPSVNDSTTAVICIDQLTAVLAHLSARRIESRYRGKDGALRLVTLGPTYADLVAEAFDRIRGNAAGNVVVLENLLGALERLSGRARDPARRAVLVEHARAIVALCNDSVTPPRDRRRIDERCSRTLAALGA